MGEFKSIPESLSSLKKKYGGEWKVSEELNEGSFYEVDDWKRIIRENNK